MHYTVPEGGDLYVPQTLNELVLLGNEFQSHDGYLRSGLHMGKSTQN